MATVTTRDASPAAAGAAAPTGQDKPGFIAKLRAQWPVVDHVMVMLGRYNSQGGNQLAAGITYYSVLAIFPIFMLVVAVVATILANDPTMLQQVQQYISHSIPEQFSGTISAILDTAIANRGAMFGIGGLTALWSGLGWMNNLRVGISAMWDIDANAGGGNFFTKKLSDLVGLVGLLVSLIVAFGVTAAGSSGLTQKVLVLLHVDAFPGISWVIFLVGLVIGLLANLIVFWWLIMILPRVKVPTKSGLLGSAIGAVIFEVIKQLSTVIVASATSNPAGAVFGPVIALMVVMYLVWRVVMYVSAWTATTPESLLLGGEIPVPPPAIIQVREEANGDIPAQTFFRAGAVLGSVLGVASAWVVGAWWRRK